MISDMMEPSPEQSYPRGSRYFMIKEFGLKDHDSYGFWGLSP